MQGKKMLVSAGHLHIYKNLSFESATAYGDGRVMVTMHIKSETELRFESLEQTQAEQDEVLAELLGGEVCE